MSQPLPLTRIAVGPYEVWDGTRYVAVAGLRRTRLHFGRYCNRQLEDQAAVAVVAALRRARPELTPWLLGWDEFLPHSKRLSEKLYEVRLRKRLDRFRARLRLNSVMEGRALFAIQLGAPPWTDFGDDGDIFLQRGDDLALLEEAMAAEGPLRLELARRGAVVLDFTDDQDLLVCDLVTGEGDRVDLIFKPWVNSSAPGLIG